MIDEGRVPEWNRVRYELMRHFGHFVTESSEHFAEYVPWFIKSGPPGPDRPLRVPLDEYLRRCEARSPSGTRCARGSAATGPPRSSPGAATSTARDIIRACETGEPFAFNGNVPNRHGGGRLIDNLPGDCCVEVPCVASADGVAPQAVGALPRHLAALMQTNVNVQGLTVEAALTGRREPAWHAAMLDPHTAGELPLDEIRDLVDALLDAHGDWIPPLATGPLQRAG